MTPEVVSARRLGSRLRVPPVARGSLERERLVARVRQGLRGPLTLVRAPAGYGKTTLLASWAALDEAPGPLVWMTMDDDDMGAGAFWPAVVDALAQVEPGVAPFGVAPFGADHAQDRATLTGLADLLAQRTQPLVLVIDDGHRLQDRTLAADLSGLLRHSDDGLRVVLLTRTDPCLPVHRYRLDGALTEIRASDLAFTADETAEIVRRAGLALDDRQVAALLHRTSGWPAGVRLASMGLAGRSDTDQGIAELTGDHGDVATYLLTEVLDAQTPAMRDVLLATSVVDELSPGVFEALVTCPARRRGLDRIERGGALIEPVVGRTGHYRYHPLFRELLRAQLADEQPGAFVDQHRRAAAWFAQHGQVREAIDHAVTAGAWAEAAGYLIDDLGIVGLMSGCSPFGELFAQMPRGVDGAPAALVRAALAAAAGDRAGDTTELARARVEVRAEAPGSAQALRISLALLDADAARRSAEVTEGTAAIGAAERLLRSMAPETLQEHREVPAFVAMLQGELHLLRGDLRAASEAMDAGRRGAVAAGWVELVEMSCGQSALIEAISGHLRHADELAVHAGPPQESHAERSHAEPSRRSAAAAVARAWVAMEQYDIDAARSLTEHADECRPAEDVVAASALALVRARLSRASGDLVAARAELRDGRVPRDGRHPPVWLDCRLGVEEATVVLAQGRPDEAIALLDGLAEPGRPDAVQVRELAWIEGHPTEGVDPRTHPVRCDRPVAPVEPIPLDTQVGALLLKATGLARTGDMARATVVVERSLRLAGPERLRRPFREASPAVQPMLRRHGECVRHHPWLAAHGPAPATSGPSSPRPRDDRLVEPLTPKEQEVLVHLADLLSTAEIAEEMYVSVNTVRTHVRSILRKLGVARRNEAVRRAWDLDLLSGP